MSTPTVKRAEQIHRVLQAHAPPGTLGSTDGGTEREILVNSVLAQMFPPTFRFGSGEITDKNGGQTDQLDVVVE